jgi:hypothetical protein
MPQRAWEVRAGLLCAPRAREGGGYKPIVEPWIEARL